MKVNSKSVVIDSLKLFNRLVLVSDRETTIEDSFKFELTVMPMSLFDQYQMMRKSNKAAYGKFLKDKIGPLVTSSNFTTPLVIDGGWFLYQLNSFQGCHNFEGVAKEYLKLIPKNREVVVIFDGYAPSTKDHEHHRRVKAHSSDMSIKNSTPCTVTMKRLLSNSHNKNELIHLLCNVFEEHCIGVDQAVDDADTHIVSRTLNLALNNDVELKAEDTDILCLLIHHFNAEHQNDIIFTTKTGSFSIRGIVNSLDKKEMFF